MAEEDGQELVTKPFKFVTGKSDNTAKKNVGMEPEANPVDSRYALPKATRHDRTIEFDSIADYWRHKF